MNKMEEMIQEAVEQLKAVTKAMLQEDELFELKAQLSKKHYDSLIKVGFSPEQAIQIVLKESDSVSVN